MSSAWTDPLWLAEAHEWIRVQVGRLGTAVDGPIDQFHVQPWATVLRVPTGAGDLYFKADAPELRHEAALSAFLAARRPDCVPPPLAVDPERGWLLLADAGPRLRELIVDESDFDRWLDVLPLYAGLQIDLIGDVTELLALGVPDLRLSGLPSLYEQLLDELPGEPVVSVVRVRAMCDELAAYGLPETIQHDDLQDGQVFVAGDGYRILDWGDACISHPFFTLSVTLEGVLAWGLDDVAGSIDVAPFRAAYLEPFERFAPRRELEAAAALAMRLGWVCRAVNGRLGGSELAQTRARLEMIVNGQP